MKAVDTSPAPAATLLPAQGECVGLLAPDPAVRRRLLERLRDEDGGDALLVGREDVLFPALDVAGNLDFALAIRTPDRTQRARRRQELLALAGLEPVAGRAVATLDDEARTACLLARATASGHARLLLDDPFGGLDDAPRARMQVLLRRLATVHRVGVALASASRRDMLGTCDRIGVEEGGVVRRLATVAELFTAPVSAAEARAIAAANILTGRIEEIDPDDDREAIVRLACGHAMPVLRHPDVGEDALCLVAVRPDHLAFAAMAASDLGGAALPATLVEHRQLGDHLQLRLRLADGTVLAVRRPSGTLTPRDLARASLPEGASVAWRAAQATAFPHPDG